MIDSLAVTGESRKEISRRPTIKREDFGIIGAPAAGLPEDLQCVLNALDDRPEQARYETDHDQDEDDSDDGNDQYLNARHQGCCAGDDLPDVRPVDRLGRCLPHEDKQHDEAQREYPHEGKFPPCLFGCACRVKRFEVALYFYHETCYVDLYILPPCL